MSGRNLKEFGKKRAWLLLGGLRLGGVLAGSIAMAAPGISQESERPSAAAEAGTEAGTEGRRIAAQTERAAHTTVRLSLASGASDASGGPGRERWTVVLDPGHGGVDKGAVGASGLEEKDLVLSTARIVRGFLQRDRRFRVLLTRRDDRYVPLRERYEFARRHRAGLFVSIHADANPFVAKRGLSVHTLSARASDRLAARLAERHNRSDTVAGVDLRGADRSVSSILLDLVRRETRAGSARISALIVRSARNRVPLLHKPQRSANFAVLRAPDVPSALVELGFLTNPQDEELLRTMEYRKRLAALLARAIAQYFIRMPQQSRAGRPPAAQRRRTGDRRRRGTATRGMRGTPPP